jgi:hypothetical protein
MEGAVGGSSALSPAAVGGRRRTRKGVKTHLRLVKKTTVRKLLAKKGYRMRGGAEPAKTDGVVPTTGEVVKNAAAVPAAAGGRRRSRKTAGKRKSKRHGLFGKLF